MALLAEKEFLRENIGKGVFLFFGDLGFRMGARKCESDKPGMPGVLLSDGDTGDQHHTPDCQHAHPVPRSPWLSAQPHPPRWPTWERHSTSHRRFLMGPCVREFPGARLPTFVTVRHWRNTSLRLQSSNYSGVRVTFPSQCPLGRRHILHRQCGNIGAWAKVGTFSFWHKWGNIVAWSC